MVSFQLTDRFGNDTGAVVRVIRKDAAPRPVKPLYREIPVRPEGDKAKAESGEKAVAASDSTALAPGAGGDETLVPADETESQGCCWLWWILLAVTLIILFLIWKRRKREKRDNDQ